MSTNTVVQHRTRSATIKRNGNLADVSFSVKE